MRSGRVIPFSPRPYLVAEPLYIVQVGRDHELCRLRAKVLTSAGHSVKSIIPEMATAECKVRRAGRIWVFCHTTEFYELATMAATIRRARPADRLLRMTGLEDVSQAPGLFDGLLEPISGVEGLLQAVAALATR